MSSKCILAVNLRGTVNIPKPVRQTLYGLKIQRRFNATLLSETNGVVGMLEKAKEHVTWAQADASTVEKLLESRIEVMQGKTLDRILKDLKVRNLGSLAKSITEGKVDFRKLKDVRPYFRLHPPKGGFRRSTRRLYNQGGVLGKNPELPKLVESMIE